MHLIDINRASVEELKTLPGIDDAYAASIKRYRPYQNKAQLLSRKVIPQATYGRIRRRIIARQ
jgi:competence protein ComEA